MVWQCVCLWLTTEIFPIVLVLYIGNVSVIVSVSESCGCGRGCVSGGQQSITMEIIPVVIISTG